jgi:hypothetical protein
MYNVWIYVYEQVVCWVILRKESVEDGSVAGVPKSFVDCSRFPGPEIRR